MKKTILSIVLCIFIIVFCISLFFVESDDGYENKNDVREIITKALKTSDGFNDSVENDKYKITSKEDLEAFKTLFTGFDMEEFDYSKYIAFIETKISGSGTNEIILEKVNINNQVSFEIKVTSDEIGTTDMSYWYLIALIPKEKLKNVNIEEWKSPIEFK